MKSIIHEASTIAKAFEQGWIKAGKPKDFTVKIFEEPQKNFFGFTTKNAKIGIFVEDRQQRQEHRPKKHIPQHRRQRHRKNPWGDQQDRQFDRQDGQRHHQDRQQFRHDDNRRQDRHQDQQRHHDGRQNPVSQDTDKDENKE